MTATISPRATTVLERFPRCLDAANPDKTLAFVVDRFAAELDVTTSRSGRIRRNHRVAQADNEWDLLALASLHDLRAVDFDLIATRLAPLHAEGMRLLLAPDDPTTASEVRDGLADLVNLPPTVFPAAAEEPDDTAANQRLGNAMVRAARYAPELNLMRSQLDDVVRVHRDASATPPGLLRAAAGHLCLDVEAIVTSADRYWHVARCRDRIRLGAEAPAEDLVALEENPERLTDVNPVPRPHGQLFAVSRAGWEEVPVTVLVVGAGERTMGPMVVNADTGAGVAFVGAVPDGQTLRFESDGRVNLDGAEVGRNCYSFNGGVFADAASPHPNDFVWDDESDRTAHFAVAAPYAAAFEPDGVFPHVGGLLDAPTLLVGTTRWRFFVREAHFGRRMPEGDEPASPVFLAGVWDETVFETGEQPAGEVGFEWLEREPFAVCLWLPMRFESFDADAAVPVRELVRLRLDRYCAAGVHVYVKYADPRWTLNTGILRDFESADAQGTVIAGTALWGPTQPEEE